MNFRGTAGRFLVEKKRGTRFQVAPKEHRTLDGITFASAREMNRYAQLRLQERAGLITGLERQTPFPVEINGKLFCTYRADFTYRDAAGRLVVEDVKSRGMGGTGADTAYRLRKKAAELAHDITVTEIS